MKEYIVNNKRYTTICSVHEELKDIIRRLNRIQITNYENASDLYLVVQEIISNGYEFIDIAFDMGTRMENALRSRADISNYLGINLDRLEENLEAVTMFTGESDEEYS